MVRKIRILKHLGFIIILSYILSCNSNTNKNNTQVTTNKNIKKVVKRISAGGQKMLKKIFWLGHDSFRIESQQTIYFDPYNLDVNAKKADLILITHEHYDHCVPDDVAKIQTKDTIIVATTDCLKKLSGNIKPIKPNEEITIKDVKIKAVAAYNINKKFHPKNNNWVGYIIEVEGVKIYHAGDTDYIPEMKNYKCNIALLPVSGTYVMTAQEAVQAANDINPEVVIPMHYGAIVGSEADALKFKELYSGNTEILKKVK